MKNKTWRHGDVQLICLDSIPGDAKSLGERKALAFGEKTGHHHSVDIGELSETKNGELYLKVDRLAGLSHQEHKTKNIEKGCYRVVIKRQYDPTGGWNPVRD